MSIKQIILMLMAIIVFGYFVFSNIVENKNFCTLDKDCSLSSSECCPDFEDYECYSVRYATFLKIYNARCLILEGPCKKFIETPICKCVDSVCTVSERNETAFKEVLENMSKTTSPEWGT